MAHRAPVGRTHWHTSAKLFISHSVLHHSLHNRLLRLVFFLVDTNNDFFLIADMRGKTEG